MKKLLITLLAVAGVIGGGLFYTSTPTALNLGAELPQAPALFETSLAAPITANATEMTLVSNSIRGGGTLSGYNCFTIDEGSAQAEFVCGNASGTAVTNLVRGISPSDGISEVAALKFPHRRGASVKITDFPIIQLLRAQNNGDATFENVLRYAGDVVPSGASDLADVGYVLSVVNGGAVDFDSLVVAGRAGETVATGTLVYFARADQEWYRVDVNSTSTWQNRSIGITQGAGINGTSIGGGGVLLMGRSTVNTGLVAGSIYFASTSGAIATTSSALTIGEADSTSVLYFNPTAYNTAFLNAANTFTATNTFSGAAVFNSLITGHASTVIRVYTSTSTWTKPAGLEYITIWVCGGGGNGASRTTTGPGSGGGGGAGGCAYEVLDSLELAATTSIAVGIGGTSTGSGVQAGTSFFGTFASSTGGTSAVSDSGVGGAGGIAFGGDLNINGQAGGPGGDSTAGGNGGSSFLGFGGAGVSNRSGGSNGSGFGAGGGGGGTDDATDSGGTSGTSGVVIVTEYY